MTQENAPAEFNVVTKTRPTFYFIGVTTGKSAMMRLFPLWTQALGRPEVVLEGVDLKLHDTREAYRQAVAQIKYDPLSLGALVTTHKIDLLDATRDMFDYLDPYAVLCDEVSSISKRDGRLEGHAKDPIQLRPEPGRGAGARLLCVRPVPDARSCASARVARRSPSPCI